MSVLLTHAYFLNEDPKELKIMRPYPPLGLLYISAWLSKHGLEHQLIDSTFSNPDRLLNEIKKFCPKVMAIYVNLMTRKNVVVLMQRIREHFGTQTKILLGGPETRYHYEEFLNHGADALVVGEGELTAMEATDALLNGTDLSAIQGLAWLSPEGAVLNPEREKISEMDEIPFPARDQIDMQPYLDTWRQHHGGSSMSVSTMRGCPYTCRWCSRAVYGLSYRRMSAKRVVDELEQLVSIYDPDRFWFVDDVFTVSHKWLASFEEELQKRGLNISYECITRADRMNAEVIDMLKRSGCFRVWIGAESGSQKIIDAMDRRVDVQQVQEMILAAKARGIEAGTFIMLGYPGETEEDIDATIDHLKRSDPDQFTITVTYPIKGTELWQEVEGIQTSFPAWADSSDRDVDFQRNYSQRYYQHAVRRVVNEVNYHKLKKTGKHRSITGLKTKLKFKLAMAAMKRESTRNGS